MPTITAQVRANQMGQVLEWIEMVLCAQKGSSAFISLYHADLPQ